MSAKLICKAVVTWGSWRERILERAKREDLGVEIVVCDTRDEMMKHIGDADAVLLGEWDAELHGAARQLKWLHALGGGVTGYLFPELVRSAVPFTCGKPCFALPGAEFALAAMLMFSRRNHLAVDTANDPLWQMSQDHELDPEDISGKTLGIIGLGGMGQALAQRASALGMRVVGTRRRITPAPEGVERLFDVGQTGELLRRSDYVVIAVPHTADTEGMVTEDFLTQMKPSAFLIDVSGRSVIFDFPALVRAIEGEQIAGVCLQPSGYHPDMGMPARDSAFWRRKNVAVTPCRGTSVEQAELCLSLFFENLRRFQEGQPLEGLVDKEAGY